jgi:hypothetical protein
MARRLSWLTAITGPAKADRLRGTLACGRARRTQVWPTMIDSSRLVSR